LKPSRAAKREQPEAAHRRCLQRLRPAALALR
jgi:hypothetical protein